jgi:hypothetical protein
MRGLDRMREKLISSPQDGGQSLGKVVLETGHVSAQVIRFFNEHYRLSGFGQLHRSRDACNPASYDQGLFSQGYVNSQEYCV